ncbi:MAG: hypothetical protein ACRD59_10475 [Candidatus Acidiferrales bacterium]
MFRKLTFAAVAICICMAGFAPLSAQTAPSDAPKIAPLLPRDQEIALAESAAPASVSKNAAIFVVEDKGYTKVRDGSNGFTCLVERDLPLNIEPICYDEEGSATLVLAVMRKAELRRQGKTEAEVQTDIGEGYASGRFRAPRRSGMAYMLSPDTRVYSARTHATRPLPPHLMFYAPYMKNSDLGLSDADHNGRLPFVVQDGQPDAFIIVLVRDAPPAAAAAKAP